MQLYGRLATKEEIAKFQLRKGDVLITKDSEEWDDIAVPAYVSTEVDNLLCGYHLAQVRPKDGLIDGRYLLRAFSARGINDQFRVAATGITRFGLGKYWLDSALFLVPPLDEQRAIAGFLDREIARIDVLIAKKRRQIELLQEKRTALIAHAVTNGLNAKIRTRQSGIKWLGEVPDHWHRRKLGYIAQMLGGCTPSKANEEYWSGSIPWVSPKDMKRRMIDDSEDHISDKAIQETSLRVIDPPVVLIVVRGMILAHSFPVALTAAPVTVNQDMKVLRAKPGLLPEYLAYLLEGISSLVLSQVEDSAHGTKCLRTDLWKSINVFIPEPLEQAKICAVLDEHSRKIDRLVQKIHDSIQSLREYHTGVISAAVTGKVVVPKEIA